jgi:flagellar biosynthesis protein FliP
MVTGLTIVVVSLLQSPAAAQGQPAPVESPVGVNIDSPLQVPALSDEDVPDLSVTLQDGANDTEAASQSLTVILLLTVMSLAPTLLILVTSFTRIIIVLGITRNALSLQGIPPNQVLIGLALFLSLFVMAPVLTEINDEALQPLLEEEISQTEAFERGMEPLRVFMLEQVRDEDLATFVKMTDARPETPDDVALTTLDPGVRDERAAGRVHHRLPRVHPVPDHRHRRVGDPDVHGHGDAAAGGHLVALQVVVVRHRRRVGAAGADPRDLVLPPDPCRKRAPSWMQRSSTSSPGCCGSPRSCPRRS